MVVVVYVWLIILICDNATADNSDLTLQLWDNTESFCIRIFLYPIKK